jgi:hypothetical protein
MKAKLKYKGKRIEFDVKKCEGIKKYTGLILDRKNALLFEFKKGTRKAIHSLFCPDFLAIWLDKENKVLEHRLILESRTIIKPEKKFFKLLEVPINEKYFDIIKLFLN